MIRHLSYVACDKCGNPAQPNDGHDGARLQAKWEGFARPSRGGFKVDLCPECRPDRPLHHNKLARWDYGLRLYFCAECGEEVKRA